MTREIIYSSQFKKDMKLAMRRGHTIDELVAVVTDLANDVPLPAKNKDHALKGEYAGCRECHIKPDWLLIYAGCRECHIKPDWLLIYDKSTDGELHILNLIRTGTHSDLFKK